MFWDVIVAVVVLWCAASIVVLICAPGILDKPLARFEGVHEIVRTKYVKHQNIRGVFNPAAVCSCGEVIVRMDERLAAMDGEKHCDRANTMNEKLKNADRTKFAWPLDI